MLSGAQLTETMEKVLLQNELDGNINAAYRFSDPDGIHSGKSGYSFGLVQFDINNNPSAILALREMNFTTDEIAALKTQTGAIEPLNAKLRAHADIVNKWDDKQVLECLNVPLVLCKEIGVAYSCDETFLHIADYHNQFYMSRGGKLYTWLKSCHGKLVTPEMVRDFKLTLAWGQSHPEDVERRYHNIVKIMRGN
jgi:hypothetical protein